MKTSNVSMKILIFTIIFSFISCSTFQRFKSTSNSNANKILTNNNFEIIKSKSAKDLSIVFSHNINGETQPCGCRHFPLGGLPQVAGMLSKLKTKNRIVYIDSGDMLSPSSNIPKSIKKSLEFSADTLVEGMNKLNLNYFVPGDQDFAFGIEKLKNITKKAKFKFLISNLKDQTTLKHINWIKINQGKAIIYIIGIILPSVFNDQNAQLFTDPMTAITQRIQELKLHGYKPSDPYNRLIVVSHSGLEYDKKLAAQFPMIDWIIGSHTQSFLTQAREEGTTKLVQVLSRNHYLGQVKISSSKAKTNDKYKLLEIREELQNEIKQNPFINFLNNFKLKLKKIQASEEKFISYKETNPKQHTMQTSTSCIECHQSQGKFWSQTPHSIAYLSLIKVKSERNTTCITCHSLGYQAKDGFNYINNSIVANQKSKIKNLSKKQLQTMYDKYIYNLNKLVVKTKSIRNLHAKSIHKIYLKMQRINNKLNIDKSYLNVQCLNCHSQTQEHPFSTESPKTLKKRLKDIKKQCLQCHNRDQSISWYRKNKDGKVGKLNQKLFIKKYRQMTCPKYQR